VRIDLRFRTSIAQSGKTTTGIQVPEEVVAALGSGRRPAVTVQVTGAKTEKTRRRRIARSVELLRQGRAR
jgi:hypothetical protein